MTPESSPLSHRSDSGRWAHHRDDGECGDLRTYRESVADAIRVLEAARSPTAIDTYSHEKLHQAHGYIDRALERLHETTGLTRDA